MPTIDDFNKFILELIAFLEGLITLQEVKLKAVLGNNLTQLEECMKEEQVAIMKSRNFDKKRDELQASLGFSVLSYQEIIQQLPDDKKVTSQKLFGKLQAVIKQYQEINQSVASLLEINLHSVEKTLTDLKTKKHEKNHPTIQKTNFSKKFV